MAYIAKEDYLKEAQALPKGRERRIQHYCGEGDVLKIEHTKDGFRAYCFRCGTNGFAPHKKTQLSQFDFLKRKEEEDVFIKQTALPRDFTNDIPNDHALWLYKSGIGVKDYKRLGFGYSAYLSRVILPVYDSEGTLVYVQARATDFPTQQPKYLNIKGANQDAIMYWQHPEEILLEETVVLTEDILSAARIGEVTTTASLLGTKLSDGQALNLREYGTCIWWLDGDSAGISGARKGSTKLQFLCETQRIIRTPKDPKCYSKRIIKKILLREADYDYDI